MLAIGFPSIDCFGRHYDFGNFHFFAVRLCVGYEFSTSRLNVHGLSIYGGAPTIGPVLKEHAERSIPGNVFFIEQGFRILLTHNWAIALDLAYINMSIEPDLPARRLNCLDSKVGCCSSSEQFSVAPGHRIQFQCQYRRHCRPLVLRGWTKYQPNLLLSDWVFAINIYH